MPGFGGDIMTKEASLEIPKIKDGTVIDHIPSENIMKLAEILSNKFKSTVTIGINFESKRLGKKGILKMDDTFLTEKEVNKIAILAKEGTLNIIKDFNVTKKYQLKIPDVIEEILKCPNPNCITNNEKTKTKFIVNKTEPLMIRCRFCERSFGKDELIFE